MISENNNTILPPAGNSSDIITTRTSKTRLGDDGIIRSAMLPGAEDNLETAKENVSAGIKVSRGEKRPLLLDISNIKSMDRDARIYYANSEKREGAEKAVALLIKSPLSRMIGNLFLGLNKSTLPTRLFTDENKALEWLKNFLDKP
jgi:hypothetical protein